MKKFITLSFLLLSLNSFCQDITGEWNGALKVSGIQLRLVIHVTKTETSFCYNS